MKPTRSASLLSSLLVGITLIISSAQGEEKSAASAGNGNPVLEVSRANLDGYRLVSLTLAAGEDLPDPVKLPDASDRANAPMPPVHVFLGQLDGKLIQFWTTQEKLSITDLVPPPNAPPNMDHVGPDLVQLRERDASKLTITKDALRGSIRFGLRTNRLAYWVVFAVDATMADSGVTGTYTWTVTRAAKDHTDTGEAVLSHSGPFSGGVATAAELTRLNAVAAGHEYLSWRGDGSGCAKTGKARLTEDAAKIRMSWVSEDDLAGNVYGGYALYTGGFHPPMLADGRIFVAYYRPTIDSHATQQPPVNGRFFDCASKDIPRYSVKEADEVIVCIDAATGVTLWKRAFIRDGENMTYRTKYGPWLPPCIDNDRLFAEGTLGHVYCLDIHTGNVLWRAERKKAVGRTMTVALQTGDGVVLNSDGAGLDVATGQQVWKPANVLMGCERGNGVPGRLKWVHEGVTYFVTSDGCVRARDGKECWRLTYPEKLADPNDPTRSLRVMRHLWPVIQGDYLVVSGGHKYNGQIHENAPMPTTCYKMYPDRVEKLWEVSWKELPIRFDRAPVIVDGHVYFLTEPIKKDETDPGHVACINLVTGKVESLSPVLWEVGSGYYSLFAADGVAYISGKGGRFLKLRPEGSLDLFAGKLDGKPAVARLPLRDGYMFPIMLDGRLFRRTGDGFMICYDLRKPEDRGGK